MPILHKFYQVPPIPAGIAWDNRFKTHNAILDVTPYEPEVMFIGTFNHGFTWNPAEFFYGRNYFWPIFENIAANNPILHPGPPIPDVPLATIFSRCKQFKMTFADIVKGTTYRVNTHENRESVRVTGGELNEEFYWNDFSDKQLNYLGSNNCLDDNIQPIIEYICNTPSIKHIYFTWKLNNDWLGQLANQIQNSQCASNKVRGSILSPSGNGFGDSIPGYPTKIRSIQHAWIWVNLPYPNVAMYPRQGFVNLDHDWLTGCVPGLALAGF